MTATTETTTPPGGSTPCGAAPAIDPMRRCTATTRSGARCRSYAIVGAVVCRMHGGAAPQVKRAASRRERERIAVGSVGALLSELEVEFDNEHPIDALLRELRTASAMAAACRLLLGEGGGLLVEGDGSGGYSGPHVLVGMLGDWSERAGKLAKAALDVGVEERKVRRAEQLDADLVASFRRFEGDMREVQDAAIIDAFDAAEAAGIDRAGLPEFVRNFVRSAWSAALPTVVRAATEPAAIDAREVGG